MEDLSKDAIAVIDKILSDQRTLNSSRIDLYYYSNTHSSEDTVLNDVHQFLIEEGFVTSNNPFSEVDKFLVKFTANGRKLHKSGSVEKYYFKTDSTEKRTLQYLQSQNGFFVPNSSIKADLGLDEIEGDNCLQLLIAKGYINSIGPDGHFSHFSSEITPQGRIRIDELTNSKPAVHFQTINDYRQIFTSTVNGNYNAITTAGLNVNQVATSNRAVIEHLRQLNELGVHENVINQMVEFYLISENIVGNN